MKSFIKRMTQPLTTVSAVSFACALVTLPSSNAFAQSPPASSPSAFSPTAVRLLQQASFGATPALAEQIQRLGVEKWIDQQLELDASRYFGPYLNVRSVDGGLDKVCPATMPAASLSVCKRNLTAFPVQLEFFRNALTKNDQLRQRVAFALSQILVTSAAKTNEASAIANYQNILLANAFGNFKDVLVAVTLSPMMGHYLDMVRNAKSNPKAGTEPNENYARELLQLFSIGLVQLNPDGSVKKDSAGNPLPSYTQDQVEDLARAFTGWSYDTLPGKTASFNNPANFDGQMLAWQTQHDVDAKVLLNGKKLPANQTANKDLMGALDIIANHPNVAPFIAKQLIQKLVTSNPSPAYVARISAVFNNNGRGVRGDLRAVVKAILMDSEARQTNLSSQTSTRGKTQEPVLLLTTLLRGLEGQSDGVALRNWSQQLGQLPYASPSVFNFFAPNYQTSYANATMLNAPEFEIINPSTTLSRLNIIKQMLYSEVKADASVKGAIGTRLKLDSWFKRYPTPTVAGITPVVSALNTQMFAGTMSATLQQTLVNTATQIIAQTTPLPKNATAAQITAFNQKQSERIIRAVLLVALTDPEFLVMN
jgi:uncharacterized protein (DUF1800 family)